VTTVQHSASEDPIRNERFRLGIEGSGIGVWDLDLATHQLLWSNTTRTLFGVPDDLPLTYELFLSLLTPEERERTQQAVARSAETGCGFDLQYRVNGQSQLRHWVRARGSIVKSKQGAGYLSGIMIEIDDQKQTRKASNQGKPPSLILETIPDAMIVIDGNGISVPSAAAERQFGYKRTRGDRPERQYPDAKRPLRHDGYRPPSIHRRTAYHGIGRIVTDSARTELLFRCIFDRRNAIGRRALTSPASSAISPNIATQARLQEPQSELVHVSRLRWEKWRRRLHTSSISRLPQLATT
jgi:two-component system sensor kinase FixL